MIINASIQSAENNYKQILEDFFTSIYDEKSLPSHGIDHHRRVWNYAKEIAAVFSLNHPDPLKLMIACYLHDAGMSLYPGIHHGKYGRELCLKFLAENHLIDNDYENVLHAIEFHDIKEYKNIKHSNDILTVLSAADDMDAFGFIGIYRYLEIYYSRGIPLSEAGSFISENAAGRFDNFVKNFGMNTILLNRHKERYEVVGEFFSGYNLQAECYCFGGNKPEGYCGAMELMISFIKSGKKSYDFHSGAEEYFSDPVIKWFYDGFNEEIKII